MGLGSRLISSKYLGSRSCASLLSDCGVRLNFLMFLNLEFQQLYLATGGDPAADELSPLNGSAQPPSSLSLAEPVACAGNGGPILCSDAGLPQSEQLCVVCHYFPLSRALLPCRHTCICAVCFCECPEMNALLFAQLNSILSLSFHSQVGEVSNVPVIDHQLLLYPLGGVFASQLYRVAWKQD